MSSIDHPTVSYLKDVEDRIVAVLRIYPRLSPSMLHIGIGTSMPTKIWRPVLQDLIDRKIVVQESKVDLSAKGRSQSHTILSLEASHV